jgi:uncharacterized iron-regulated protein
MLPDMSAKPRSRQLRLIAPLAASLLAACSSVGTRGGDYVVYDTASGQPQELDELCDDLARFDVVFLGEEHDNDAGHELQLWTLARLAELRPNLVLTMEQFEADTQGVLDLYMQDAIDEATFLEHSRPWGNYPEHYKPMVEFAKQRGYPVIAANIPRPLARRVSRGTLESIGGERYAPWLVWVDEPEYLELFAKAMGRESADPEDVGLQRWFAAQCVKDEKMAESIAEVFASEGDERPLVVHICGKFHSDKHLGTVSRLARRRPELEIAVVSMNSDSKLRRELTEDERSRGEAMWLVKPQP